MNSEAKDCWVGIHKSDEAQDEPKISWILVYPLMIGILKNLYLYVYIQNFWKNVKVHSEW